MVACTLLLHANLQYAEFSFNDIPDIINKSYLPVLNMLHKNPGFKVVLNWTGWTLETLAGENKSIYPDRAGEAIDLIRELLDCGQIDITGTSWSHAILPLCDTDDARKQIELGLETTQRILYHKPKGFFPPELAIDPLLPGMLRQVGYEWTIIDDDLLRFTKDDLLNTANDFKPTPPSFMKRIARVSFKGILAQYRFLRYQEKLLRRKNDLTPVNWLGTGNTTLPALRCMQAWNAYSLSCLSRMAILNEKRLFKMIRQVGSNREGFFIPFSSDMEFYGFGGNVSREPIPIERLERFLMHLESTPAITLELPSEYFQNQDAAGFESLYLRSGSWVPDKDIGMWDSDPDNQRLNRLCDEVRRKFEQKQHQLSSDLQEKVWKALLLAQNSDGRGWTPIPEKRLFCYNSALEALELLETA
ncbi:MAG: hypothetical protein ACFFGZ_07480 [Candidatus Thorarchaeota archaeon]